MQRTISLLWEIDKRVFIKTNAKNHIHKVRLTSLYSGIRSKLIRVIRQIRRLQIDEPNPLF